MKKILAMAIGMAAIVSIASAQTATYSQNAVGFINIEMEGGNLYALSVPFVEVGTAEPMAFTDIPVIQDAADGSTAYLWNAAEQKWGTVNKTRGKWTPAVTTPMEGGEFFFFKPKNKMTATIAGEVPSFPSSVVSVYGAGPMSAISYPYPVEVSFADTDLASQAKDGATVYFWNEADQKWAGVTKTRGAWKNVGNLTPGRGVFFKAPNNADDIQWTEDKKYDWP